MWMINIIKIITGETAIKLLLIVMTVSEKEFHVIKIGDKILCNVYRSANRVVTVELNEHWKDAGDKYDN